jgi:RHS repeat-associated protein
MKYDNDGNATQVGGYGFAYDAEGRLESSSINNSATNFIYDAEGRRVMQRTSTGDTMYLYDAGGMLMAEYPSVASPAPCTTCYLSQDHLGSTRLVLDGSGTAIGCHDFKPFGEEIQAGVDGRTRTCWAATETTLKFTGKERDAFSDGTATKLDFFGARYFAGAQGRFASPDGYGLDQHPEDPQSWNLYSYVRNRPLIAVDPNGEFTCDPKTVSKEQCEKAHRADERAGTALNKIKDPKKREAARRAHEALGGRKDNGVVLTIGDPGEGTSGRVDVGPIQAKTNDNPNGQNITVTLTAGAFDGSNSALSDIEHEGSHTADLHDWINRGSPPGAAVNWYESEFRAYSVEASLARAIGFRLDFGSSLRLGAGTPELLELYTINGILRRSPYFLKPTSKITLWQWNTGGPR